MAQARKTINSNLREGESKVSVNDFVLKAAALALRQVSKAPRGDAERTTTQELIRPSLGSATGRVARLTHLPPPAVVRVLKNI